MWWRFLTFCILVSFILIVVLNYLHDRPVIRLFFKRCCDDGIENDQVVFESFSNNYLKERLVAVDFVFDNGTLVPEEVDIGEVIEELRGKVNVHDLSARRKAEIEEFGDRELIEDEPDDEDNNMLKIEVFELEISENPHKNDSDLSEKDSVSDNLSDIETKDDVTESTTEKLDNNTISMT